MNARQLLTVVREERILAAAVLVVVLAAAVAVAAFLPTTYTSTARFYVASPQAAASGTDSYNGAQLASQRVASYVELVTGVRVARDASALLGGSPSADDLQAATTADTVSSTVVLTVAVAGPTPPEAQRRATAVSESFSRLVSGLESAGQAGAQPILVTRLLLAPGRPASPDQPPAALIVLAGLLAGAAAGVGAAVLRRALRPVVGDPGTLTAALGAPVLGAIPARRTTGHLAVLAPPPDRRGRRARALRRRSEAFRRLRTGIRSVAGPGETMLVAGVGPGHLTASFALELALVLAADGERVVLVDADLRTPRLHGLVGLDNALGLGDVLRGGTDVATACRPWTLGGIDVLTAGPAVERPDALLPHGAATFAALAARYDRVVVDVASLTDAADAMELARAADGTVVVARRGHARPAEVRAAATALRLVEARILGGVLVDARSAPGSGGRSLALPAGDPARTPRALPPGGVAVDPA